MTVFCSKPLFMSDPWESLMTDLGRQQTKSEHILPAAHAFFVFEDKRLLLTGDNVRNRETAMEILGECGFRIDTTENGVEAVQTLQSVFIQKKAK